MICEIIHPVAQELIEAELNCDRFLRKTNKGGNEIYIVDAFNSPNVMREIGRLREITFREAGGGTGKDCDIDEFDTMQSPCKQLIVWDPDARQILGGYRYICGCDVQLDENGAPRIATGHLFNFSEDFIKNYLPYTIELGRSFVRPEYQSSTAGAKALFALDNLWDGLGSLIVDCPDMKYFFGKVTMYPSYNMECRNMILHFLHKHFHDKDNLVTPIAPLEYSCDMAEMNRIFTGTTYKEDLTNLHTVVNSCGVHVPPLVNAYMGLSPTLRVFGTAINHEFGDVEETGIFIAIDEILDEKKRRHIESYRPAE